MENNTRVPEVIIIVPYRDREEHLNTFVPHMHEFLKDKSIDPSEINTILVNKGTNEIPHSVKLHNLLLRPQVEIKDLIEAEMEQCFDYTHYQEAILSEDETL